MALSGLDAAAVSITVEKVGRRWEEATDRRCCIWTMAFRSTK